MNLKLFFLPLLLWPVGTTILIGQSIRYQDPIFDTISVTQEVKYCSNATVEEVELLGKAVRKDQFLDLYIPSNDVETNRPLIILLHTGNYLPVFENRLTVGGKEDSVIVRLAENLAKLGYVVGAIEYRLGWNPVAPTRSKRTNGLINAVYRGMQDTRTAIRFFKKSVEEQSNPFGIDTSKIVVWGMGSGGHIALATAYVNEYNEIIHTKKPALKFLIDLDGDNIPDIPMIREEYIGDIWGTSTGVFKEQDDNILPFGDTLCYPNHLGYSSDFQLVVSAGGVLGDISWIEPGEMPIIAFHVPGDPLKPYGDGDIIVSTTGDAVVRVQGSYEVVRKANELGINKDFNDLGFNLEFTDMARQASFEAGHAYLEGLYPFYAEKNELGNHEHAPWQWWDALFWNSIPFNDQFTFDGAMRLTNFGAGPEKGMGFVDKMIGYFAPRACEVLDLNAINPDISSTSSLENIPIKLFPNPVKDYLNIASTGREKIKHIVLLDVWGKQLFDSGPINSENYQIPLTLNVKGMHLVQINTKKNVYYAKVILER